ncbi:MAG TPA: hypothetical protein PLV25_07765, partial [Opitutales bacterium]|nr:hypothetical protein [Opitutales bacterium]
MAGPRRWVSGWVLKIEPHGEKFERYNLFTTDQGYQIALKRISSKSAPRADFWDWAELCLESPNAADAFSFLVDYRLIKRAEFLGRNFEALQAAAQWAKLLLENLRWIEDPKPVELITQGFL